MSRTRVDWSDYPAEAAEIPPLVAVLRVAPIEVDLADGSSFLVRPGEEFTAAAGVTGVATVTVPRVKTFTFAIKVPFEDPGIRLPTKDVIDELLAIGVRPGASYGSLPERSADGVVRADEKTTKTKRKPAPIRVRGERAALVSNAAEGSVEFHTEGGKVALQSTSGEALSVALDVTQWQGPSRSLVVPMTGQGPDALVIRSSALFGGESTIRVEPDDDRSVLLHDYILQGDRHRASVAAGAVARSRGRETPQTWSNRSYTQLLIGYSHALAGDLDRLRAWVRRTDAGRWLGSDGLILAATADGGSTPRESTLAALASLPPPTMTFGLELGLRLINSTISYEKSPKPPRQLSPVAAELRHRYTLLFSQADPDSVTLAFAPAVLSTSVVHSVLRRVRQAMIWLVRWKNRGHGWIAVNRDRFNPAWADAQEAVRVISKKGLSMSSKTPSRTGTVVAAAAVVLWAAFTVWLALDIHIEQIEWARLAWLFGSVQAVAFAAAGALFGTAVQRDRAEKAEERADSAQAEADNQRDLASRGRALGALLQSKDDSSDEDQGDAGMRSMGGNNGDAESDLRRQYAQMSRALFGKLVD
jgi:hypothetical protein